MTVRTQLRAATRTAHERVDAAFGIHDLTDRSAYARFLSAQAAALLPLEQSLTRAGAARMIETWDEHRRAPLLIEDLGALGVALPPPVAPTPITDDWELAGALYVLEGSRLGGAMLRRSVPAAFPSAFLSAAQAPGRWTRFAMSLHQLLDSPSRLDAAIATALATFACFEQAADRVRLA